MDTISLFLYFNIRCLKNTTKKKREVYISIEEKEHIINEYSHSCIHVTRIVYKISLNLLSFAQGIQSFIIYLLS